jgi:hypothetical protein
LDRRQRGDWFEGEGIRKRARAHIHHLTHSHTHTTGGRREVGLERGRAHTYTLSLTLIHTQAYTFGLID